MIGVYLKNDRVSCCKTCPNNSGFLSQLRDLEFGVVVDQAQGKFVEGASGWEADVVAGFRKSTSKDKYFRVENIDQ